MNPSRRRPHDVPEGFTLIEIVVVLFILGVVISMAAVLTRGVSAAQKRSITSTRLAAIDAALVQFVQQQRRLPCPADGTVPSTSTAPVPGDEGARSPANTGGCAADGSGNYETNGVVPWRLLGLSENDITDGWGRRITYRIDPALAANGAMDMSWCDPAGTEGVPPNPAVAAPRACNTGCTSGSLISCTPPSAFLVNRGLTVRNIATIPVMDPTTAPYTGAAYVLVSAGESGGGAYLGSGVLGSSTMTDGTQETKNYASRSYVSLAVSYYVDDVINDTSGTATHFDDIVLRPSIMNVISRAGLGPRAH